MDEVTVLYRPIGAGEYALLVRSGFREFPAQLVHQPMIYSATSEAYASHLARNWNVTDYSSGHVGYVTRFRLRSAFLARYPVRRVGASMHEEYWIPTEHMGELNANLVGPIEVIAELRPDQGQPDGTAE